MMDGRGPPRRGVREVCTETEVIGAAVVTDDVSLRRWYRELPRLPHQRAPDGNTWKLSLSLSRIRTRLVLGRTVARERYLSSWTRTSQSTGLNKLKERSSDDFIIIRRGVTERGTNKCIGFSFVSF